MLFSVRRVRRDDLMPLLKLYTWLHEARVPEASERLAAVWEQILADPRIFLLVGEADGQMVSSVTMTVIPNLTRGLRSYALIENVVTHGEFRRMGYGSAVLRQAVATAARAGCYKVMLMTGSREPGAMRFYERAGFSAQEKRAYILHPAVSEDEVSSPCVLPPAFPECSGDIPKE